MTKDFLSEIGSEFDLDYYRETNPELRGLPIEVVAKHMFIYGGGYGKPLSQFSFPETLINFINKCIHDQRLLALEIGPFDNPLLRGESVRYFDVLDSESLKERAARHKRPFGNVPEKIHFVEPNGDLSICPKESFDIVFSSHCIEHQPDFIRHLQKVSRLLKDGGVYVLKVPDKRYMFDHFIAETNVAEVINAYENKERVHTFQSLVEHRMLITHNDGIRHWLGDHGNDNFSKKCFDDVLTEFKNSKGNYIDVHKWQFTPQSFRNLVNRLNVLGFTDFVPYRVFDTLWGSIEFTAILTKQNLSQLTEKSVLSESEKIEGYVDKSFPIDISGESYVYYSGWFVCTDESVDKNAERKIGIRMTDGKIKWFPVKSVPRRDIIDLFQNNEYEMSGFECILKSDELDNADTFDIFAGYKDGTRILYHKLKH